MWAKSAPESLRDNPVGISSYLSDLFSKNDPALILQGLSTVLRAQNVQALARETGLRRDRLYRTFGGEIDPQLTRVMKLFDGLGVRLTVVALPSKPIPERPKLGRPKKKVPATR